MQLEEQRGLIPSSLLTKELREEFEEEFNQAMASFKRETLPRLEVEEQERIDLRLFNSFKRFKEREPENGSLNEDPFTLKEDTETFSGENASYFRKKEETELALRIQEGIMPDPLSLRANLGRFQQAILQEEIEGEESIIKDEADSRIKELFEGVSQQKKQGEDLFNGLPIRRFIFPELEREEKDKDLTKRRERYLRIRDRAERTKRKIKAELKTASSLPRDEDEEELEEED